MDTTTQRILKVIREASKVFERFITPVLGLYIIRHAFYIFNKMINGSVTEQNRDITMMLLGVLAGTLTTILGYYYGSSHKSKEK
jgi:hypothetical protein